MLSKWGTKFSTCAYKQPGSYKMKLNYIHVLIITNQVLSESAGIKILENKLLAQYIAINH